MVQGRRTAMRPVSLSPLDMCAVFCCLADRHPCRHTQRLHGNGFMKAVRSPPWNESGGDGDVT